MTNKTASPLASPTIEETFAVPGCDAKLVLERDTVTGRLVRLACGKRVYLAVDTSGERVLGDGLAVMREVGVERGMQRFVRTAGTSWDEEYRWDELGRPVHVDGVDVERDRRGRVTACRGDGVAWRYAYAGHDLAVIDGPPGMRHITRGVEGRPVAVRCGSDVVPIGYADGNHRDDVSPLPTTGHRDALGRLWTIENGDGEIETTFLWDGFACLGRIDGPPGAPLAATFSLDLSCTPVRVITAEGVTRIPRDAFGESLLEHRGVPGLYGGIIHDRFVHFRSRVLDPRCGSFDRRDPWHGRSDDPRRTCGFDGALLVETPDCGPYALCQYDPIGRTDPTGEFSWVLLLSDLTWSLQHNTAGLFGFDWTIGFWSSFIVGVFGFCWTDENWMKRFFDYEGLYNDRTGVWAVRRGFWGVERPFTYQHLVISKPEVFDDLKQVNVIDAGDYRPTQYGTLLRVDVAGSTPLLLRGNNDAALAGWTRCGGKAEAVAPGSPTPWFPRGGLHLDTTVAEVSIPRQCDLAELVPTGTPQKATVVEPRVATSIEKDAKLSVGAVVFLTDGAAGVEAKTVAEVDEKNATKTKGKRVRFQEPGTTLVSPVRLSKLKDASSDTRNAVGAAAPDRLDMVGHKFKEIAAGNPLRFRQGGKVVGAGTVKSLEAQVKLDSPLPAGHTAPLEIFQAVAGSKKKGTLAGHVLTTKPRPDRDDAIVLSGGGALIAAVVTAAPTDNTCELDRTDAELAVLGANVEWQPLSKGGKIGVAAALPGAADLTYTPQVLAKAPTTGFVLIRDASSPKQTAAREITARNYDGIVIDPKLPGNVASPYDVDRYDFDTPHLSGLTLSFDPRVRLPAGVNLNARAVQIVEVGAPALAAAPGALNANVAAGKLTLPAVTGLVPSQFILISGGGKDELNVVKSITADLTLDRKIDLDAAADIDVVPLAPSGLVYDATAVDATHLVVSPQAGGVPTQFPRFVEGAIVQTVFGGTTEHYVVAAKPEGSVITIAEGPTGAAIASGAAGTVQLVVPIDPANDTGTWRIGMNGKAVGAPPTDHVTVDIWSDTAVAPPRLVALVQNKKTHATNITAAAFTVTPLVATTIAGAATVSTYGGAAAFYAATTVQSGTDVTLTETYGAAPPTGPNIVVVIPYGNGAAVKKDVEMNTGSVLVPEDAENYEIDRHKSLVYHELTHTRQAQVFGPLLMGYFPLFAMEGLMEVASDVDLPEISGYVAGTIAVVNGSIFVNVADADDLKFEKDDKVELTQAGQVSTVTLGEKTADGFAVSLNGFVVGPVQVRRFTSTSTFTDLLDVVFNIFSILTLGGVMNLVAGTVWGGLLLLIFKLVYWLKHGVGHGGQAFPATVVDPLTIHMTTDEGRRGIQGFGDIYLQQGKDSEQYEVKNIVNDTLTLAKATTFTGAVDVKPYSSADPLSTVVADSLTYHDATVPDAAKPAQVRVPGLELHPFDVVSVNAGVTSTRINVVAVDANDTHLATLKEAPPTFGPDRSLRIAYVDENDPFGSADSRFLTHYGMGWMRYLFDPYRQFQYGVDPKPGSFADWIARIGRYAFSSHSWSAVIPGKLFLDDLFYQPDKGRVTGMEQQASEESGNVYSALVKMRGDVFTKGADFGTLTGNVGDIGRFWHTPDWFSPSDKPFTIASRRDAPSINMPTPILITVPDIGVEGGGVDLNRGATTNSATPGTFVPDIFYDRPAGNPYAPAPSPAGFRGPQGVLSSTRGMIPTNPQVELSMGCYVAFTHPGKHRVTVDDRVGSDARDAHDAKEQTVLFDVTVNDVTVRLGDTLVTDGVEVHLLPFQRAPIVVEPSPAGATWVATVLQPGKVVTTPPRFVVAKMPGPEVETVEISRLYATAAGTYAEPILGQHGVHVPVDVHIPIRFFTVRTVDAFQLVDAPESGANPVAKTSPGTKVYALIPTNIGNALRVTNTVYAGGVPAPMSNPKPKIKPVATPAALAAFINVGKVIEIEFSADDPPEDVATMTFTANVGPAAPFTPITASIDYEPHFKLTAAAFEVKRNGPEVVLNAGGTDIASAAVIEGNAKGIHLTPEGDNLKIKADKGIALGQRRIRAVSKADGTMKATRTIRIT